MCFFAFVSSSARYIYFAPSALIRIVVFAIRGAVTNAYVFWAAALETIGGPALRAGSARLFLKNNLYANIFYSMGEFEITISSQAFLYMLRALTASAISSRLILKSPSNCSSQ